MSLFPISIQRCVLNLIAEIKSLFQQQNISSILVTHSKKEAFYFADQVAITDNGRIQQLDTPFKLYKKATKLSYCKTIV